MRRTASEILRNLEMRIARLEKTSSTPKALVELGRRGRDHLNTLIFEWLGTYGEDDYKSYVAVDVEDQVEFFDSSKTYVKLYVELEYIDIRDDREKTENVVFHLSLPAREIKYDKQDQVIENSVWKSTIMTDSSDLDQVG